MVQREKSIDLRGQQRAVARRLSIILFALLFGLSKGWAFDVGQGTAFDTPMQLFEHQLGTEWHSREHWPDLIVLEQDSNGAFEGQGSAYLLLVVEDHAKCWNDEQGSLQNDSACTVAAIKRIESNQALPLQSGPYAQARLIHLSALQTIAWASAADGLAWLARQSPTPAIDGWEQLPADDLLDSASALTGSEGSAVESFEVGFNLAGTQLARSLPASEVFSEAYAHLTSGPVAVACDTGDRPEAQCSAGGPGASACSCAAFGSGCSAVCSSGFACCNCRGRELPSAACCTANS